MYPVELHGQQVILREFTGADLPDVLSIVGDDEVTSWLSFDSRSADEARVMLDGVLVRARQEPRAEYYLAVALPGDSAVLGFARLGLAGTRAAKLGFAVRRSAWGHGYATDAARTLITFGFGELGLHRIEAGTAVDNVASQRVLEKNRFTRVGLLRAHLLIHGEWVDHYLWERIVGD